MSIYGDGMISWKLSAIALVIFSALMANVIAKLEASFNVVANHATSITHHGNYAALPPDQAADNKVAKDVDVLRDSFLLSWVVGGCIPGACVGIWIRALTRVFDIAKTFGVSLFTSFCVSPWAIKNYMTPTPETCLLMGFLVAVGAWLIWEVALAIGTRLKDAAVKSGWIGVKREILGEGKQDEPKTITPPAG
jgi:hypothetical protein